MLFLIRRYSSEQRKIKQMMRDFRPRTGRIVAITIACAVAVALLTIAIPSYLA